MLDRREVEWQMKRKFIQLESGDKNTNFFRHHVNLRKKFNIIWERKNRDINLLRNFKEIIDIRFLYFKSIYSEPGRANIFEILRLTYFSIVLC